MLYVPSAFAVAAHLEPEILIIDEVLAVGDAEFQKKLSEKCLRLPGKGRTVLFVSHNMGAVRSLCSRAIFLFRMEKPSQPDPTQIVDTSIFSLRPLISPNILNGIGRAQKRLATRH